MSEGNHTRFALFAGGYVGESTWLATDANVSGASVGARPPECSEVDVIYVPNALAVAAPDLLEALKGLAECCTLSSKTQVAAHDKALEAIEKARGVDLHAEYRRRQS